MNSILTFSGENFYLFVCMIKFLVTCDLPHSQKWIPRSEIDLSFFLLWRDNVKWVRSTLTEGYMRATNRSSKKKQIFHQNKTSQLIGKASMWSASFTLFLNMQICEAVAAIFETYQLYPRLIPLWSNSFCRQDSYDVKTRRVAISLSSYLEDACSNFRLKLNSCFHPIKDNYMSLRVFHDSKLISLVIVYLSMKQFVKVNNPREKKRLICLKKSNKKVAFLCIYQSASEEGIFRSFSIGEQLFDRLRPLQSCFFSFSFNLPHFCCVNYVW